MADVLRGAVVQMSSQDEVPNNVARAVELLASSWRGGVFWGSEEYPRFLTSIK